MNPKTYPKGSLRIWWIPQIPMQPFYQTVKSIREAKLLLSALARYDQFQYSNYIKPDFSNGGGLHEYDPENDDGEGNCWTEWCNEDGYDINHVDDEGKTKWD